MRKLTHRELLEQRITVEQAQIVPRHPIRLLVEDVRSLYNVGSMFRTADSFLIDRIILTGYTPTPPRKEISKTALGADETVPWSWYATTSEAITAQRADGYHIVALELTTTAQPMSKVDPAQYPLCIVVGNELTGIQANTLAECDASLMIPMFGVKHSLNVAVATGIALYELVRQLP